MTLGDVTIIDSDVTVMMLPCSARYLDSRGTSMAAAGVTCVPIGHR